MVLRATADDDIGRYAIFKCLVAQNGNVASGALPGAYWFQDKKIKSGDFVVVYSKNGAASEKVGDGGSTSHFFYWGSGAPLWKGYSAVLVAPGSNWKRTDKL